MLLNLLLATVKQKTSKIMRNSSREQPLLLLAGGPLCLGLSGIHFSYLKLHSPVSVCLVLQRVFETLGNTTQVILQLLLSKVTYQKENL